MTYLDYIVFFEKCDRQQPKGFSGNATRLYLKLLAIANEVGWPESFAKSDPYLAGVCGYSINTMKDCRDSLEAGGLITSVQGGTGRNGATTYTLLKPSNYDVLPRVNQSNSDGFGEVNPSNSDVLAPLNQSKSDGFTPESALNTSNNPSNFDTLYIDKDKEGSSAADAAAPRPSLPAQKKESSKKSKPKGATNEEIAALPLPFDGAEFAEAWQTFYTTNTKQAGKALTAFGLMLKKLGKYPEGYAVVMLERATMGDWQGVENDGTARGLAAWQTEQVRNPAPAAPALTTLTTEAPEVNEDFLAEQAAAAEARRQAHFARYAHA